MRTQGCEPRTARITAQRIAGIACIAFSVLVACSAPGEGITSASTATSMTLQTVQTPIPTTTFAQGDLAEWESVEVLVGETPIVVALADEEEERQQGLMGIADLGDFDGMLFAWTDPITTGFFMKDTLIALDLFFFDGEGVLIDRTTLEPCRAEPCPVFVADGLFRWVLEAPAGNIQATGKLSFPEAG
ncbi:MAG TPA: DUF192 domain-containing protein [Acidimicrobiia bacterium]|nr:DUF192 domain-containing protein [Acidimicrobiia bacterium]